MIWIDLEHKRPTDTNIPNWVPWTQAQWDAWLAKSAQLVAALAALDAEDKRNERNELIDANSTHWGVLKEWCWPCQRVSAGFQRYASCTHITTWSIFDPRKKLRRWMQACVMDTGGWHLTT